MARPIPAVEGNQDVRFPTSGLDARTDLERLPPGMTPVGTNVRGSECLTQRSRGGQRSGLSKYLAEAPTGQPIQELAAIVTNSGEALSWSFQGVDQGALGLGDVDGGPAGIGGSADLIPEQPFGGGGGYQPAALFQEVRTQFKYVQAKHYAVFLGVPNVYQFVGADEFIGTCTTTAELFIDGLFWLAAEVLSLPGPVGALGPPSLIVGAWTGDPLAEIDWEDPGLVKLLGGPHDPRVTIPVNPLPVIDEHSLVVPGTNGGHVNIAAVYTPGSAGSIFTRQSGAQVAVCRMKEVHTLSWGLDAVLYDHGFGLPLPEPPPEGGGASVGASYDFTFVI